MPTYEVVTVNYLTRRHLARTLAVLPHDVWVTVADNSALSEPVDDLVGSRPRSRYLGMVRNVGYARAANHGVAQTASEVVIILNPACFPGRSVLEELAAEVATGAGYAACGPAVVDERGVARYGGGGWLPTPGRSVVHALGAHRTRALGRRGIAVSPALREPMDVEWLAGTCLAVHRKTFEAVGGLDERFFLYNEDMGLGRRLHRAGFRQRLRADIAVEHIGGASSESIARDVWDLRAESMAAFVQAYNPRWEALAIRSLLAGGYLGRALAYRLGGRRLRATEMMRYVAGTLAYRAGRQRAGAALRVARPSGGGGR